MTRDHPRTACLVTVLVLGTAARGEDVKPAPAPAPTEAKAPAPLEWAKDLDAAKAAAKEKGRRILAVVTEEFYPSEPCRRLEKALEDPAAKEVLGPFVPLRVVEKEDLAFSKGAGLKDLGHPYSAILDADGTVVASLRGAYAADAWAKEVRRLAAAADAWSAKRSAAEKAPVDAGALFGLSEALRDLGRVREADDVLSRAENADPEDRAGLAPLLRFRRLEARVEDRMAAQDFEGVRTLLDTYEREFPNSPKRPWVALWRALARAYRGETDGALEDLREIASSAKDEVLAAQAKERVAALERVVERRK